MLARKCRICGKLLWIKKSHVARGWGKYCSKKCQAKSQVKGKWVKCDYCGKDIWRTPKDFSRSASKKFFCSRNCHCSWENKNKRCGENAPNWVAGKAVYRALLKRHNRPQRCRVCGISNIRVLVVHHIDGNRRNNRLENLEWLCRNCHHLVHFPD